MEKKNLKKKRKKTWVCSKGCKNTRTPCVHLEKLLPSMRKGTTVSGDSNRVRVVDPKKLEVFIATCLSSPEFLDNEIRFFQILSKADTTELEKTIIHDRVIKGWTFQEIADERGFPQGRQYVSVIFNNAVNRLRKVMIQ